MRHAFAVVALALISAVFILGCPKDGEPLVVGTPVGDLPYQPYTAPKLASEFNMHIDTTVRVRGAFERLVENPPDKDYILMKFSSDFGKLYLYCHEDAPGAAQIKKLEKGDPVQAYGLTMFLAVEGVGGAVPVVKVEKHE